MASSTNNKAAMFLALLIALPLILNLAESRQLDAVAKAKDSTVDCVSVYGAQVGDSCFSVTQAFKLTAEEFAALNPNLVCEKIFVGQWLCVAGSVI